MKQLFLLGTFFICTVLSLIGQSTSSKVWTEHASASDIFNNIFYLYNDTMKSEPDIVPVFMHNYNPNGASGQYVAMKQGLYFTNSNWRLFNQNKADFVEDTYYNLWVPGTNETAFKHSTSGSNSMNNQTIIDHPDLNGNPNAIAVICSKWEGEYDTLYQGLFYTANDQRWRIYNEGGFFEPMVLNRHFHVVVADKNNSDYSSFLIEADSSNTVAHILTIDHPDLNNNPGAMLFATHVYNPKGALTGEYNNHPVGVYFSNGKWRIYNESLAKITPGTAFNVIAFPQAPVATSIDQPQKSTAVNIFPNPASPSGMLQLELETTSPAPIELSVFNLIGERLYRAELASSSGKQTHAIDLQGFERGMYLVKVKQEHQITVQKLVIQ